jgi:hypothetical protein
MDIFDANTVGPLKYIQTYDKYSSILSQQVLKDFQINRDLFNLWKQNYAFISTFWLFVNQIILHNFMFYVCWNE